MTVEAFDLAAVHEDDRALSSGEFGCDHCELGFGDEWVLGLHLDWAHGVES